MLYLKGISKKRRLRKTKPVQTKPLTEADITYLPTQTVNLDPSTDTYKNAKIKYGNFTNVINSKF